jgi:dTDP-4-dehydrorhamnose 3,5-epimerase
VKVEETALPGVLILTPTVYRDSRGAFMETWNLRRMEEAGLPTHWVQDNFSISKKDVLRGMHYQITQPQGKLVRVAWGAVLDVAVDLRRSSPSFGKHVAVELTEENGRMLWIPPGFGHGFLTLSETAAGERTILWNDPELGIAWPVDGAGVIVSDKDAQGVGLPEAEVYA